ncbi:MAG TPA: serine hydrolase domain-containing protein [Candidatus Saccharimonadales bacterium]|nr:serine hydrolase domain-containing protein [Candidatus Saccharimonadales bacterium]
MRPRKIPGGAIAVVRGKRLVYTQGYGTANRERKTPVRPNSLFRIASISKPFTAVAVLHLIENGKLRLDQPVIPLLAQSLCGNTGRDPRWQKITIQQLLQHTGGWDRDKSFDPMFRSRIIAEAQGVACPPGPKDVICYMLEQPLDFDPGTRYAYSNFGYCILGRIIEKVTRLPYEKYVQQSVLAPLGITKMRLGGSQQSGEGEVDYYTSDGATTKSVFDEQSVQWPYGGFCLEAMDAHGGWIASVIDLARFAAGLEDPSSCPVLQSSTLETMYARPPAPVGRDKEGKLSSSYYGCGWLVRPVGAKGKANYWHNGSLPGTSTLLVRRSDGLSWAVVFNQRSDDDKLPDSAIDPALHLAADSVAHWPETDLFPSYRGT